MNYYDFHIGDYTTRTAHLEPMEDLAYRRMLDLYYLREEPLPVEAKDVARLIRLRGQEEAVEVVLREFFVMTEAGWTHAKCEEVIARAHAASERARTNGKKGGRPATTQPEPTSTGGKNPEETQPVISGNPEKSKSQAPTSHFPLPTSQEEREKTPRKRDVAPHPTDVDAAVWDDYLTVRKAKRAGPITDTVLTGLRREAAKAGIDLADAVRACAEYGWQGFDARWYAERKAETTLAKARGESFAEQSARLARERVAGFAPGVAAASPDSRAGNFIDAIEVSHVPAIDCN